MHSFIVTPFMKPDPYKHALYTSVPIPPHHMLAWLSLRHVMDEFPTKRKWSTVAERSKRIRSEL